MYARWTRFTEDDGFVSEAAATYWNGNLEPFTPTEIPCMQTPGIQSPFFLVLRRTATPCDTLLHVSLYFLETS